MDYQEIGRRIREQRKEFKHISQEQMAYDLNMYQADISNIEQGKKGSGIDDLSKLELISKYFGISLSYLLSGIKEKEDMEKYMGEKMVIKEKKEEICDAHWKTLQRLTGAKNKSVVEKKYQCGNYMTYIMIEIQQVITNDTTFDENGVNSPIGLAIAHLYTFYGNDVVSTLSSVLTNIYSSIALPLYDLFYHNFAHVLPLDLFDNVRLLNPYVPLYWFTEEGKEREKYGNKMMERIQELRDMDDDKPVLLISSAYVKEDCRRKGIFRLNIDILKKNYGDCIMWLNMHPYSGIDLHDEYEPQPTFNYPRIGQFSLNNYIAERVGFTINPDLWNIDVLAEDTNLSDDEVRASINFDDDTHVKTKKAKVNKVAYYLPERYLDIIKDDGDMVQLGRALQKMYSKKMSNE